jgi:alpha-tubulin suppressor-like RCC1 family protein
MLKDGYVRCWGNNDSGQLGQGSTAFLADKQPFEVPLVDVGGSVTALAAGQEHTCALLTDGSVRCWGRNSEGELGLGNITAQSTKTPRALGALKLGEKAIAISAKAYNTCALLASKAVRCWGPNTNGELGLGDTASWSETKTPDQVGAVALGGLAQMVAVGAGHSCALLANGTVRCWGAGIFGELGLGSTANIGDDELPSASGTAGLVGFPSGRTAVSLTVGQVHSCALMDNGFVQCWGDNSDGALGLLHFDNIGDDELPAAWGQTLVGTAVSTLVSGDLDTCALYAADGALRCWGYNAFGQLGQADIVHKSVPSQLTAVAFGGGLTAKVVAGGTNHTCVLLSDGQVRCWGNNDAGQLGFGSVSKGAVLYIGGDAAHTPDKLASIRVLP